MNTELMVELADKAGFVVEDDKIFASDSFDDINEHLETFTELIVQECLDIMSKELRNTTMLMSNPPQSGAIWDAQIIIAKHFGVKL